MNLKHPTFDDVVCHVKNRVPAHCGVASHKQIREIR